MDEDEAGDPTILRSKLADLPPEWNALTERIIGAAIEVHRELGPGYPERTYEDAMVYELTQRGLIVARQVPRRVPYKAIFLSEHRLDLLVENLVVLELKAVEKVPQIALAQLAGYLRVFELPIGLLLNFHVLRMADGIFRRVNSRAIESTRARLAHPPIHSAPSALSAPPRSS